MTCLRYFSSFWGSSKAPPFCNDAFGLQELNGP